MLYLAHYIILQFNGMPLNQRMIQWAKQRPHSISKPHTSFASDIGVIKFWRFSHVWGVTLKQLVTLCLCKTVNFFQKISQFTTKLLNIQIRDQYSENPFLELWSVEFACSSQVVIVNFIYFPDVFLYKFGFNFVYELPGVEPNLLLN